MPGNKPLPSPSPLPPSSSKTCEPHQCWLVLDRRARSCSGRGETPQQPVLHPRDASLRASSAALADPGALPTPQGPWGGGTGCKRGAGGEEDTGVSPQPAPHTPRGPQSIDGRSKAPSQRQWSSPTRSPKQRGECFWIHGGFEKRKLVLPAAG